MGAMESNTAAFLVTIISVIGAGVIGLAKKLCFKQKKDREPETAEAPPQNDTSMAVININRALLMPCSNQ